MLSRWFHPRRVVTACSIEHTALFFFLMWTVFKVLTEFVTILLLSYVLVFWQQDMWDLSSPTRDRTLTPYIGRRSLNHWTARAVPSTLHF